MKNYTDNEIKKFFEDTWWVPDEWGCTNCCDIELVKNQEDYVEVKLSSMYEAPGLNFTKLSAISQFFDTTNLSDPDTFSYGGCETCDYGSSYGFTITVRPNIKRP